MKKMETPSVGVRSVARKFQENSTIFMCDVLLRFHVGNIARRGLSVTEVARSLADGIIQILEYSINIDRNRAREGKQSVVGLGAIAVTISSQPSEELPLAFRLL